MTPNKPIYVTKPSLASLEEFIPYLEQIWASGVMTHNGPLVQELEARPADHLDPQIKEKILKEIPGILPSLVQPSTAG